MPTRTPHVFLRLNAAATVVVLVVAALGSALAGCVVGEAATSPDTIRPARPPVRPPPPARAEWDAPAPPPLPPRKAPPKKKKSSPIEPPDTK
jgi:hypothetical protein